MFGNTFHCQLAIHSPVYVCVFFGSVALRDEMRRVVRLLTIRTLVYRVKACRDNHLHYEEPLDECIAAIDFLRMIGMCCFPNRTIYSCAVCM